MISDVGERDRTAQHVGDVPDPPQAGDVDIRLVRRLEIAVVPVREPGQGGRAATVRWSSARPGRRQVGVGDGGDRVAADECERGPVHLDRPGSRGSSGSSTTTSCRRARRPAVSIAEPGSSPSNRRPTSTVPTRPTASTGRAGRDRRVGREPPSDHVFLPAAQQFRDGRSISSAACVDVAGRQACDTAVAGSPLSSYQRLARRCRSRPCRRLRRQVPRAARRRTGGGSGTSGGGRRARRRTGSPVPAPEHRPAAGPPGDRVAQRRVSRSRIEVWRRKRRTSSG